MNRPIIATIHTDAFRHNLGRIRELAPESKIWSVVKAKAYGHTLGAVLQGLESTDGFALLDIADAQWLRDHAWGGRILLLEGLFSEQELELAVKLKCDLVIHSQKQLEWLESFQNRSNQQINVFLKLNSGMNRLGFKPEQYRAAFHRLHAAGYRLHHMTHFANADQVERSPSVGEQMECFEKVTTGLDAPCSLANSAAILWHRNALGDWVRPGILLYGVSPTGVHADIVRSDFHPVMQLRSEIIDIQELKKGDHVGYGGRYQAPEDMLIGVIACGYADGYPRHAGDGTPVWVEAADAQGGGVICPIVGQVSMDMLTIDLRGAPNAKIGSIVELWGSEVPVDDVAQMSGTIGYELICALAQRVPVVIK
ncbi:alanine racemase [Polynucleobacter arcticus]|uniref:Alanine racemase n=1 Tax=Polynucleobacter arcticus TaxID=1743165 RepID=A0A6M9PMD8_9BURK|nr:alanine racemase [Polynucleobacter arcticus]QKM61531.1 alanine racemase [Polynucleobacter arcticus]